MGSASIRINAAGTINPSVLNLSQRYMLSGFAYEVLKQDITTFKRTGRDRFGSESHRQSAIKQVGPFQTGVNEFTTFLEKMKLHLPAEYRPCADWDWCVGVQAKIERRAEELTFLRSILCVGDHDKPTIRQLAPDLWGQIKWDAYHGRSIAALLTGSTETEIVDSKTRHRISFRRDGLMCHREYSWIRVDANFRPDERYSELAVNWFLLETFTDPLIAVWDRLDPAPIISRGCEIDATEEETTAALVVALAEHNPVRPTEVVEPRRRLSGLKLSKLERILAEFFNCKCSQGKGSERKVFRPGYKQFTFGCHGFDRLIHPTQLRKCLSKLGVTTSQFIAAIR